MAVSRAAGEGHSGAPEQVTASRLLDTS